ncbi:carbohydrate kinase [Nereida sp. MMG025]|uniref:carbohydrate kinase family protein n=1 Tax=Nereida sp. MMG025 TaxID=2909981 RepID=UPI001F1BC88D|nr:carbohydrate kinase [Nereida sp. MMG025]MCF6445768.1 carbohydrate kinase [Nereida sp. MMG025]
MILCCGEALVDLVETTAPDGRTAFAPHAGGAVMNTAVGLGRLEVKTKFLCGLSQDMFADVLLQHMHDSNVDTALCPTLDAPTTLAFVKLVDGQASYAFFDENSAMRQMSIDDLPSVPQETKALFFGGISLTSGKCAEAYAAFLAQHASDVFAMIDPNIRPSFIQDEAGYRARLDAMISNCDVIKLSDEDLVWLEGEGEIEGLAKGILARGPKLVLITEGSKGATAYHNDFSVTCPVVPVDLTNSDTIGAGDTFNAGFLASLHDQDVLDKAAIANASPQVVKAAVEMAIQAAAITVSRKGANPPWRHELQAS